MQKKATLPGCFDKSYQERSIAWVLSNGKAGVGIDFPLRNRQQQMLLGYITMQLCQRWRGRSIQSVMIIVFISEMILHPLLRSDGRQS